MHKVQLSYALKPDEPGTPLLRNSLLDLLHAVQASGSISAAAKAMQFSYRHVWGELKRWEAELGQDLIVWDKGQSARLSEFGDKLLWAERQAQARLAPQIAALRADLERAFAVAFDPEAHVLTFYASHDDALACLHQHAAAHARLHLDIRFTGSVDAIQALNQGRCVMAGFHTLHQPDTHSQSARIYQPLLKPGLHKIIGFASRQQGLIVARGNPLGIAALHDLARPVGGSATASVEPNARANAPLRFVNRAIGTGTRLLLDELLANASITPQQIAGYASAEPSHAAVAQAVASGRADAGLGIAASAQSHGLGFVPLIEERYHLVCLKSALDQPAVQALLAVLRSRDWQAALATITGYAPAESGQVLAMHKLLPWWAFKRPRMAKPR
ncbi:MAG: substrate-binding domain-containing protein [Burkholderiales bacterium]